MLIGDLAVDATSSVIFGQGSDLCATSLFVCTPGQFWQRRREAGHAQFRLVFMLIALCVQTLLLALRWREIVGICGAQLHLTAGLSYSLIALFSVKCCHPRSAVTLPASG
jgi:hypothetical protein